MRKIIASSLALLFGAVAAEAQSTWYGDYVCVSEDAYWINPQTAERGNFSNHPKSFKLDIMLCEFAGRSDCIEEIDDYQIETQGLNDLGDGEDWSYYKVNDIWENRMYAHDFAGETLVLMSDKTFRHVSFSPNNKANSSDLFWVMSGSCFSSD